MRQVLPDEVHLAQLPVDTGRAFNYNDFVVPPKTRKSQQHFSDFQTSKLTEPYGRYCRVIDLVDRAHNIMQYLQS